MARPRKEEALDIPRQAIVETIRLLGSRPVSDLTMAEVAAAVGCRAPALYNHFRNKAALLRAVHDEGFERMYREKLAVAARSGADAFGRLREGGLAYLRFALENPSLYALMFSPPPEAALTANPFENDPGRKSLGFLRASIVACQAEGYLPERDPDLVAFTLWSAVHGAASLICQGRVPAGGETAGHLIEATIDTVMDLIAATRGPAEP